MLRGDQRGWAGQLRERAQEGGASANAWLTGEANLSSRSRRAHAAGPPSGLSKSGPPTVGLPAQEARPVQLRN